MNRVPEEAFASETQRATEPPTDGGSTGSFDYRRAWREPQGIGIGAAVLLTVGASAATVMVMRRRARARVNRLALLAVRAALLRAVVPKAARGVMTLASVGGGLAAAAILQDRLRHGHAHNAIQDLSERLEALQAQAVTHVPSDRPRPRDVVLGAAVGLALAGIVGRIGSGRKAS